MQMPTRKLAALAAMASTLAFALVPAVVAAQDSPLPMRNTVTVSGDVSRAESKPIGGNDSEVTTLLLDVEYARTMWPGTELTFAGGSRGVRTSFGGSETTQVFRAWQVGARFFFAEPRRAGWTPYIDASVGEGWLNRLGGRTAYYGFEGAVGLAVHLNPRSDMRISANADRYVAWNKVGEDRDVFTRLGLRLGFAFRF
jgi:hypothetical protein